MDCPHCRTENLIGAKICAACGKSMVSMPRFAQAIPVESAAPDADAGSDSSVPVTPPRRQLTIRRASDELSAPPPAWGAGPAEHDETPAGSPPPTRRDRPAQALCRVCTSPFDVAPGAQGAPICPSCRSLSAQVEQMAPNEVLLPTTAPTRGEARSGGGEFGDATPAARPRPPVVRRPARSLGPVVAVAGLVAVLAGVGVVVFRGGTDRSADLLRDVRATEARVETALDGDLVFRHAATLRIHIVREDGRMFNAAARMVDVEQTTVQECEAALVSRGDESPVFDVVTEGSVRAQSGKVGGDDAREAGLYPWQGRHPVFRVRASPSAPLVQLDGASVTCGADVAPLFHLGAIGATTRTFRIGDRWKASLELPLFAERTGRLFAGSFPAEISYAGASVRNGLKCAAFRVKAAPPRDLPGSLGEAYNRSSGTISGAVWIELATGIAAGAELDFDIELAKDAGKVDEELHLTGRLTIERN